MAIHHFDRELKKGSAELLILSLLEAQPRHGYELSKLIEARSGGTITFRVASLYPLPRLELVSACPYRLHRFLPEIEILDPSLLSLPAARDPSVHPLAKTLHEIL